MLSQQEIQDFAKDFDSIRQELKKYLNAEGYEL